MCNVCGCGAGETTIDGKAVEHDGHGHSHGGHFHVHADGTAHDHDHDHDHDHTHDHAQAKHVHYHLHEDGTSHEHVHDHAHGHGHSHTHDHDHEHSHAHDATIHYGLGPAGAHAPGMSQSRMVKIEKDILSKNDSYANDNRGHLAGHGIFALNLVSSPGSGKTTLLVKTIGALNGSLPLAVIEGDQQTDNDAARIRATGAPALQINTGKGCHLDAFMVGKAIHQLDLQDDSLLLIENVGNLVCPASFDLGEAHKVAILSVTEGEDKPLKYPDMFLASDLMLLNKCDLLPYLTFDADLAVANARRVNPDIKVIRISATSGEGMEEWLEWIRAGCRKAVDRKTIDGR
ncbi:MAG: hydrogenase nickel incorporation protein HypB [Gammaproteobacteria bacterium]|nr:hydrogenase nickel incorporation protein HypB [Gammaproteobacteria bacterium]MBU1481221.1 hydrogenase nickel incorporation protein HypB [Gammaproteobacteria bacterium]